MRKWSFILCAIAVFTVWGMTPAVHAAILADGYNAMVFGDFSAPYSDVEGRLAVGGDVTFSSYSVGDKLTGSDVGGYTLIAGGDIRINGAGVYHGHIVAGGSVTTQNFGFHGGSYTITQHADPLPVDFAAQQASLTALSSQLAGLDATGSAKVQWSTLNLVGDGHSALQIFDIDSAQLAGTSVIELFTDSLPDDATIILNVSGDTALLSGGLTNFEAWNDRILFNFHEATTLNIQGIGVHGSILAPLASVNHGSGVVHGQVIVNEWHSGVQINHNNFTGNLPVSPPSMNRPEAPGYQAATPEPTTAALWALGALVGLGAMRRRR